MLKKIAVILLLLSSVSVHASYVLNSNPSGFFIENPTKKQMDSYMAQFPKLNFCARVLQNAAIAFSPGVDVAATKKLIQLTYFSRLSTPPDNLLFAPHTYGVSGDLIPRLVNTTHNLTYTVLKGSPKKLVVELPKDTDLFGGQSFEVDVDAVPFFNEYHLPTRADANAIDEITDFALAAMRKGRSEAVRRLLEQNAAKLGITSIETRYGTYKKEVREPLNTAWGRSHWVKNYVGTFDEENMPILIIKYSPGTSSVHPGFIVSSTLYVAFTKTHMDTVAVVGSNYWVDGETYKTLGSAWNRRIFYMNGGQVEPFSLAIGGFSGPSLELFSMPVITSNFGRKAEPGDGKIPVWIFQNNLPLR
jgi:hypothetical protein